MRNRQRRRRAVAPWTAPLHSLSRSFRRWLSPLPVGAPGARPPYLEALEDRCLPSGTPAALSPFPAAPVGLTASASQDVPDLIVQLTPQGQAALPRLQSLAAAEGLTLTPTVNADQYRAHGPAGALTRLAATVAGQPYVQFAQREQTVTVQKVPNDPSFGSQWDMGAIPGINAPGAWDVTTGSTKVTVADIDTGQDYNHPDLYLNVWINQAAIPNSWLTKSSPTSGYDTVVLKSQVKDVDGDGLITFRDLNDPANAGLVWDNNGDGRIDAGDLLRDRSQGGWDGSVDVHGHDTNPADAFFGWNYWAGNNDPMDSGFHGTHTAGTIGAVGNNGTGIAGVNWQTQIMLLAFIGANNLGSDTDAAAAIRFAADHGARVTNASWGDNNFSPDTYGAIQYAGTKGMIFVAAAGNSTANADVAPLYPAGDTIARTITDPLGNTQVYPGLANIISVAATDSQGNLAGFSNYGATSVNLAAPGAGIYSTVPGGYNTLSGTSMATPHVTGTVALVEAAYPNLPMAEAIHVVLSTTTPDSALTGQTVTGGLVNAAKAVSLPDLNWAGGGFSGVPATASTATPFTISRTYNVSYAAVANSFTISYYASAGATPNPATDPLLATEIISTAADRAAGPHAGTSPALQFSSRGTWYVYAQLDSGSAVLEADRTNNVFVTPQPVTVIGATIVHNGDPGYAESGPDWQDRTTSSGYGGVLAYAPAGTGQDTATWQFTNLAPGAYDVEATWSAYPNRATNAPYSVYDGSTLLTFSPVPVNQQLAPSGPTVNGFMFQSLGTFTIQSGTLKVVLSNNANGYVFAEALRANPLPAPTIDLNWTGGGLTGPPSATTGTPFTINRTYTVTGGVPAANFTIAYYASTHATPGNPDDVLLGTETVSAAAGKTVGIHAGTSPALLISSLGTYSLYAVLDSGFAIPEVSEADKVAQASPPVTVTGPVIVDNGQPGYTESGPDWQDRSTSTGYGGNLAYAPAGTGQDTVTWQVSNLAAGSYEVDATWYAYGNRASNAPYSVYDGSTLLTPTPILVNQQQAPAGITLNAYAFQPLGTFTVTSGTLKVVLSNNANGYVIADAIRVAPLPAPAIDLNWNGGLTGPTSATTGTPFTIARTYAITGGVPLTGFTISYYASTHPTLGNPDDVLLGTETISAAAATVGTHAGTSPALQIATAGTYYLYAVLDSGDVVAESNENNNVAQAPAQVTVTTAPPPVGPVIVYNGQAGYSESGPDWQDRQTSLGYGGVLAYAPAGTGQDTASWQVSNLAAGSYEVDATWYAYSNRATNAPYNVYDGNTLLTASPILVNQQLAPSGTTVNGFMFQSLGTFNVTSGTIKVVLSNAANGYVFAEAVRFAPVKPTYLVDNGQPGYAESGPDWQDRNTSLGYGGNLAYAPAGTGQDTASWQVTGLAPGTYDVQVTWYAFSNRATNAPYNVYDGGTLLTSTPVLVNQQLAPSGTAVNGFMFQSLGQFTVTSGTLKVVLSNAANGYVFADALRLVQL